MKKICILLMGLLLCGLTACGIEKPPKESEIAGTFPEEITTIMVENPYDLTNADVYQMDVAEVTLEKRQTNEKTDIAYCVVDLENELYAIRRYLTLNYIYYDKGGWILENWSEYQNPEVTVLSAPFNASDEEVKWSYSYDEVLVERFALTDETTLQATMQVTKNHANAVDSGRLVNSYSLQATQGSQWLTWTEATDTSSINRKWLLEGRWAGYQNNNSEMVTGCELSISDFAPESGSADGICVFMYAEYSPTRFQWYQKEISCDLKDAELTMGADFILFEWSRQTVQVELDTISATTLDGSGFKINMPELSRVEGMDNTTPTDVSPELKNIIDDYFSKAETLAQKYAGREYNDALHEEIMEDELYWELRIEENVIDYGDGNVKDYEITEARQYSKVTSIAQSKAKSALVDEFGAEAADLAKDFAEVLMKVTYEDGALVDFRFGLFLIENEWRIMFINEASVFHMLR